MFVDPAILKNVFFILKDRSTEEEGTIKKPVGTGFIVRVFEAENFGMLYFVTAKHVIENEFGVRPSTVRLNQSDGMTDVEIPYEGWFMSEKADVAVFPVCADGQIPIRKFLDDSRVIDEAFFINQTGHCLLGNPVAGQTLRMVPVSIGDDLVSPGLFTKRHESGGRIIPIARFARISLMPTLYVNGHRRL